MANWARLQEQLTGLPVIKRAKHSIHFDKGNGEIVANFSSKPCHYEEKGVWKPIDTKLLLLPDGFYGSPHSDVKIHKDGRVKAGGYQQKSALVDAKEGVVDGDKIVREFKFGTQYLYMKEDGFRQETVITRPPTTAEAKYLIASESGELPSKYKRSDITAVDADGAVHEFVNLGQFKKWLDAAAYPVTIDPDFAGSTADGFVYGQDADYATARATSGAEATNSSSIKTGQTTTYQVFRGYFMFDTSAIGAGSTVTQANLKLTVETDSSTTNFVPLIVKYAGGANREARFDNLLNNDLDDGNFGSTGTGTWSANTQKTSSNLSTAWVNKIGTTYYGVVSEEDRNNSAPTASEVIEWHSANASTVGYRPFLSVTYTAGSTGVPKHFLHYARLRSN